MQKIVLPINNLIWNKKFFNTDDIFKYIKYFLDITGDVFSVLGFLIYLEIIVLKFCKYDYNTKKNIMRRSFGESYGINKKQINDDENEQEIEDKSFSSEEVQPENETPDLTLGIK